LHYPYKYSLPTSIIHKYVCDGLAASKNLDYALVHSSKRSMNKLQLHKV